MRRVWPLATTAALLLSQSLLVLPVRAATTFPDVADSHMYRQQIDALAGRGIIKGNPDGSFKPGKTVNRAEMLTFLYRATNKAALTPSKQCMKDIERGSWYEAVVCDAITRGYVSGYADGFFKPGQDVNRVESLKMISTVFGFKMNSNLPAASLTAYSDLSLSGWYAPYVLDSFDRKILPIPGQEGGKFYPEWPLLRGEAAAYIFNALGLKLSTVTSSSAASSAASMTRSRASTAATSSAATGLQTNVDFPFSDDGNFVLKAKKAYIFPLKTAAVGKFTVTVNDVGNNSVRCRLYKLNKESFALEYYVGHVVDNTCTVKAALDPGDYQFEINPTIPDLVYNVFSNTVTGDGNDGFREAEKLQQSKPKTGNLSTEDVADWYTIKLAYPTKTTLEVTNDENVRCLIYPMEDVDLYGFSGPVCNAEYEFPKGTYYIGVQHNDEHLNDQAFSVRLK